MTDHSFRKILFSLFCVTGISSILYLLVWMKLFQTIFGATYISNFVILTSFISGLAIGALLGGYIIDKWRNELKLFVYLEITTSGYALILFLAFSAFSIWYPHIYLNFYQHGILLHIINFICVFLFFLPLTTSIGAKFSVIGRYLIRSEHFIAQEIGILHSCFILGTAIGCLLIIPLVYMLGIKITAILVTIFNLVIALIVRLYSHRISEPRNIVAEFYDQHLKHFSSLNRQFSPTLMNAIFYGNAVSAFIVTSYSTILFLDILKLTQNNFLVQNIIFMTVLLCFSFGSFISTRLIREDRNLFMKFLLFHSLVGIILLILTIYIPKIIVFNHQLQKQQNFNGLFFEYTDIILMIVFPLILIGISFPIMFKIYLIKFEQIGKRVGNFYSLFFGGIVAGYFYTIYVVPLLGVTKGIITLAALCFTLVTTIFLITQRLRLNLNIVIIFPFVLIIVLSYLFIPSFFNLPLGKDEIVHLKDNKNAIFSVVKDDSLNELYLDVNGVTIAGTSLPYLTSQRMLAHIPMLINPNNKRVFISGYGNGEIPGIVAKYHPELLDCTELSSTIPKLSPYFSEVNFDVLKNPLLNIIKNDAITFLHLTERKYDVIICNYIQPERFNDYSFYTKDFFKDCRKHLTKNGIMALQLPLINSSLENLEVIINTFHSEFDHTSLWFNNNYLNCSLLLIGSENTKFKISFHDMYFALEDNSLIENISTIKLNNIYEILDCYLCGPNSLGRIIKKMKLHTYNNPYFGLISKNRDFSKGNLRLYLQLFKEVKEPVTYLLENLETPKDSEDIIKVILNMFYKSSNYIFDGLIYEFDNDLPNALQAYRLAYQTNKLDYGAKRFLDAYYGQHLIREPKTPVQYTQNAKIYYQKMEYQKAIEVLNKALELDNKYAPAYFGLGINYEILNDMKMAKRMYRRALRLIPRLEPAQERLNNIIKQEKEFEQQFKRGIFIK